MGATTTAFVVAFGAPGNTAADAVMALSDGMWEEASSIGAGIVGGDLVAAPQWVISVTALGDLEGRDPIELRGARIGDVVAVAGELGASAGGYRCCSTVLVNSTNCGAGTWFPRRHTDRGEQRPSPVRRR